MSKIWYPFIDYITCTECSICIDKCPHGAFNFNYWFLYVISRILNY